MSSVFVTILLLSLNKSYHIIASMSPGTSVMAKTVMLCIIEAWHFQFVHWSQIFGSLKPLENLTSNCMVSAKECYSPTVENAAAAISSGALEVGQTMTFFCEENSQFPGGEVVAQITCLDTGIFSNTPPVSGCDSKYHASIKWLTYMPMIHLYSIHAYT